MDFLGPRTTIPLTKNKKDLKEVKQSRSSQTYDPNPKIFSQIPLSWEREKIFFVSGGTRL